MQETMNKKALEAYIPFPGFYCSLIEGELEDKEREIIEETREAVPSIADGIEFTYSDSNWMSIARAWTSAYISDLEKRYSGLPSLDAIQAVRVYSPREYNFETDKCAVAIPESTARALLAFAEGSAAISEGVRQESFADYCAEAMRPRSGFIPFFSQDYREWGDISEWNNAQLELIFSYLLPESEATDFGLYESVIDAAREAAECAATVKGKGLYDYLEWFKETFEVIPVVAYWLPYIENGDSSGMSEEEIKACDSFLESQRENGLEYVDPVYSGESDTNGNFSAYFGYCPGYPKAADVADCYFRRLDVQY